VTGLPASPGPPAWISLHRGPRPAVKAVFGVLAACVLLIGTPVLGFLAAGLVTAVSSASTVGTGKPPSPNAAGVTVGLVVALVFGLVLLTRLLALLRSAAWLEGSTLVVRGALRSRRYDLATAVGFSRYTTRSGVPMLIAHDGRTGRKIRLPLRDPGTARASAPGQLFSPPKLYALADAIAAGGRRTDPGAVQAANSLRALAAGGW
jgi:hypothetical protein